LIEIDKLTKRFRKNNPEKESELVVLEDISFSIKDGEIVSIIGPSGCGKTTLLKIIAGLERKTKGSIRLDGKEISSAGKDRGFVFQTFNLFPWMNVQENVEFGLYELSPKERSERSSRCINLVGLAGFEKYHPHEISGGMQQRVGIARALAIEPKVLLLDEPLANVDAQTAEKLIDEFLKIFEITKKTVVYVTHNMDESIYVSDRIVVLSARPGKVKEIYEVNLPKPRWNYEIRSLPEFATLRYKLRDSLGLTMK
jgi:NitT/TauT family transport system ATP-binding protein